jgi:hypothetical protein
MLVVNTEIRGNTVHSEKILAYAHELEGKRTISSSGLEIITQNIERKDPMTGLGSDVGLFAVTKRLDIPDAIDLMDDLTAKVAYANLIFMRVETRRGSYIHASGPRAELKKLPYYFTVGGTGDLSGRGWIKRQLNFPFSNLQKTERGNLFVGSRLSMEEFTSLRTYAIDSEFMGWEKEIKLDRLSNPDEHIIRFLQANYPYEQFENLENRVLLQKVEEHFTSRLETEDFELQPMSFQICQNFSNQTTVWYFEHLSGANAPEVIELATGI